MTTWVLGSVSVAKHSVGNELGCWFGTGVEVTISISCCFVNLVKSACRRTSETDGQGNGIGDGTHLSYNPCA
jgi:hypothetical protein